MQAFLTGPLTHKLISAFSWMLIHSLWQGLLLAVVTGVVLIGTKKSSAAKRYNLVLALLSMFLTAVSCTFLWEWNSVKSQTLIPALPGGIGVNVSGLFFGDLHGIKHLAKTLARYFTVNAPFVVMIWFVFFLFKSVKMMACMVYNQRIKNYQVCEPDLCWTNTVVKLAESLQLNKTVKLLQSGYVKMPVVLGHLKPIILIPAGLLAGLPAQQVEAILLHELAHIRRNDYVVNFLQNIVEAIFFFNPGLLWISALLREERENCCDDMALAHTQNKRGFVEALISFKEHEMYGARYATAFMGKKNYLLRRVTRIMQTSNKTFGFGEKLFFVAGIVLLSVVITTAAATQINQYTRDIDAEYRAPQATGKPHAVAKSQTMLMGGALVHYREKQKQLFTAEAAKLAHLNRDNTESLDDATQLNDEASLLGGAERQQANLDRLQAGVEREFATQTRLQFESDKRQLILSQAQAEADRVQANKDREQANKDRVQADIDRAQAILDRAQADKDRAQAAKDRAVAEQERTQQQQ